MRRWLALLTCLIVSAFLALPGGVLLRAAQVDETPSPTANVTETPENTPTLTETPPPTPTPPNIVDILFQTPRLTVMSRAVSGLGIEAGLRRGRFTVFAPNDQAWRLLLRDYPTALPDAAAIQNFFTYHVIADTVLEDYIFDQMTITTLQGGSLQFTIDNLGQTWLNERARIIRSDLVGENGVVHIIDRVLIPPDVLESLNDG